MDQKILKELQKIKRILGNVVTKAELEQSLQKQTEVIYTDIGEVVNSLFVETDKLKADKKDFLILERRVDNIEQKLVH